MRNSSDTRNGRSPNNSHTSSFGILNVRKDLFSEEISAIIEVTNLFFFYNEYNKRVSFYFLTFSLMVTLNWIAILVCSLVMFAG